MSSGSGGENPLLASTGDNLTGPYDWSPDGRFLLFRDLSPETSIVNTGILPLSGDRTIRNLFPRANFLQVMTQISPSGRWVAYNSNETGRMEVYVAGPQPKRQAE
jgi:eukaryotic-like serine/threonine-protein kinase